MFEGLSIAVWKRGETCALISTNVNKIGWDEKHIIIKSNERDTWEPALTEDGFYEERDTSILVYDWYIVELDQNNKVHKLDSHQFNAKRKELLVSDSLSFFLNVDKAISRIKTN